MDIKTFVIRPVQRHSFQGRDLQRAVLKDAATGTILSDSPMNKTKATTGDGQSCTDTLGFRRPDYNRSIYDAGLSEQVANPFYEKKEDNREEAASNLMNDYNLNESWRKVVKDLVGNKTITKQQELEIRFMGSQPPGLLTEAVPTKRLEAHRGIIHPQAERTELMNFKLTLYDRSNLFKTDNLRGCLAWQLANRHPKIAKGLDYVNSSVHNWYIAEEYEDEMIAQQLNDLVDNAVFRLVGIKNKYPTTDVLEENPLYHIFSLVTGTDFKPVVKGKITSARLNELVTNYLRGKHSAETIKFHVNNFNSVVDEYESNPDLFYARYLVQQGLNTQVFQINNSKVYWLSKKDTPEVYSFTSVSALDKFVYQEIQSPESTYLPSLITELESKYAVIPRGLKD